MLSKRILAFFILSAGAVIAEVTVSAVASDGPLLSPGYNGLVGPIYWGKFDSKCDGWYQSPIDIDPTTIDFKDSIKGVLENPFGNLPDIKYPDSAGKLENTGQTIKFTPSEVTGTFKRDENNTYYLLQFHIHTPSEHRIRGEHFPVEFHFVHSSDPGKLDKLAVIGAMVRYGDFTSPFVKAFTDAANGLAVKGSKSVTMPYSNAVNAITASAEFYRYQGSLTTVPCNEGVAWLVASDPNLSITPEDANVLMNLIGHSSRITMPLSNVYDNQWIAKRKSDYNPKVAVPPTAHHYHLSYDYNGFTGPAYWGKFAKACDGDIQSPIDLDGTTIDFAKTLEGVLQNPKGLYPAISYPISKGSIKNLGDTIKFTPSEITGTFWRGPNDIFNMAQFHFHAPSEHRVQGLHYPLEVHFVHTKATNTGTALGVIGAFIDFAESTSPFIKQVVDAAAGLAIGASKDVTIDYVNAVNAIKSSTTFYRYTGSLTTPPCTEGVNWLVAGTPTFGITVSDFQKLALLLEHSARPTQPLAKVTDTDWVKKRKSTYFPEK